MPSGPSLPRSTKSSMATELTREQAADLVRGKAVLCPVCGKAVLVPLHKRRDLNTRFRCPECETVFRPTRLL